MDESEKYLLRILNQILDSYKFLTELRDKPGDLELIKKMDKIGDYWLELSLLLKEISELEEVQDNKFKIASEKVIRIYELEKEFYESIISSLN